MSTTREQGVIRAIFGRRDRLWCPSTVDEAQAYVGMLEAAVLAAGRGRGVVTRAADIDRPDSSGPSGKDAFAEASPPVLEPLQPLRP